MSEDAILFALHRLESGAAVEIRNKAGRVLVCGTVADYSFSDAFLRIKTKNASEVFVDCPKTREVHEAEIELADIEYLEIVTPQAEYYIYESHMWQNAVWLKPVKKGGAVFQNSAGTPKSWRRYARPPRAIPGVFWPELRLAGAAYGLLPMQDTGVGGALTLDFKIHRKIFPLSIFFDGSYAARLTNGNTTVTSPTRYFTFSAGIAYAFFQRELFSVAAGMSGGVIDYFFAENTGGLQGLRAMVSGSVILSYHLLWNQRDSHKVAIFLQPVYSLVFTQRTEIFPMLFEIRTGVQYAY